LIFTMTCSSDISPLAIVDVEIVAEILRRCVPQDDHACSMVTSRRRNGAAAE